MKSAECHGHCHVKGMVMHEQLVTFTRILRGLGVRVSTAELLDAVRALACVDIARRTQFKTALGSLLVKSRVDRNLFELAFESFFVSPDKKEERRRQEEAEREEEARAREEAIRELTASVQESGGRWAGGAHRHLELTTEQKEAYANMPAGERKRLQQIIESFEGNPVNDPSGLIAGVVEASLNYWRYYMMKKEETGRKNQGRALNIQYTGDEEIDEILRAVARKYGEGGDESLLHRDMQTIAREDLPRVTALVARLSRHLANRISRRYRRSNARRKIDFRRTVRNNLAYGGVPLKPVYRSRRISRPRLVVLCDVSASMVRYARFVIQFVYGLAHVVRDIETFIFSEDLERITPYFKGGSGFTSTMSTVMTQSRQWGKTTNMNAALATLEDKYKHVFTPDTYILIVSDTKTRQPGQAAGRVGKLREKVKDVIWLNTLPGEEWEKTFTVALFREHAAMFECGTVAQLDRVLRKHLI